MTTTHTQPAGCDLDSLPLADQFAGLAQNAEALRQAEQNPNLERIHLGMRDAFHIAEHRTRAAQAPQGDTRQGAPTDYVVMPKRLTAENGAKGALSGEFKESIEVTCHECGGSGDDDDSDNDAECAECEGYGSVTQNAPVSWDTIKDIYKAAVALLATPAAHTCTPADERAVIERAIRFIESGSHTQIARDTMTNELRKLLSARAAQGAGTAPAGLLADIEQLVKLADDVGRSRQSNNYALNSSAVEKLVDLKASVAARIVAFATHPAPVSTAAATTASASGSPRIYQKILNMPDGPEVSGPPLKACRVCGSLLGSLHALNCTHGTSVVAEKDCRATSRAADGPLINEGTSRAADGQQGASRAVLDDAQIGSLWLKARAKHVDHNGRAEETLVRAEFARLVFDAALARNLPAQGAAQVKVEAARDADTGCRMQGGICACTSGGSFGGCAKERSDCCTNEPGSAALAAKRGGATDA